MNYRAVTLRLSGIERNINTMIALRKLRIKDLAIVSETEVELNPGLTVITGETGTGKSLVVGAIDLLLGERGRSDIVRSGAKHALIEGEFSGDFSKLEDIFDSEGITASNNSLTLTREIGADGRSRCLVNDQRVAVGVMKRIGERICDLHGQHQHQWLLDPDKHLWFLDRFAGCVDLCAGYQTAYDELRGKEKRLGEVQEEIARNRERRELQQFQLQEIDKAAVSAGEEEELERERRELENVARIKEKLYDSLGRIEAEGGAVEETTVALRNLQAIVGDFPAAQTIASELESARISLTEMSRALSEHLSRLAEDPARLERVGKRLSSIYEIKRKYGGTIESVLACRDKIAAALRQGDSLDTELKNLEIGVRKSADALLLLAARLHQSRSKAAGSLSRKMGAELKRLGILQARFLVEFSDPQGGIELQNGSEKVRLSEMGLKAAQFSFSANPGETPRPLSRIASGGEISRVMLALKSLIAGNDQVDLLVFDEIDVGIGGETALLVGRQLRQLAGGQQVVAITHLQQLAAFADYHYRAVKKQVGKRTESTLEPLDQSERIAELGRMISGGSIGEEERRQAEKLLIQAGSKVSIDN